MASQTEKYSVAMSGEHFVAAELLRRRAAASVTMGNAKRADVVVMNQSASKVVVVEVKSSARNEWIVGGEAPPATEQPSVFVHVPADGTPPRYFVFFSREIHEIVKRKDRQYREDFLRRNGQPFVGSAVFKLTLGEAESAEGKWNKVLDQVA